ncbi:hypothetical protein NDU88_008243 [Pleurodeles waltl]|uniref:Uncharacterized protein n=1 Tax=Pleurodeles waltl TaxID=8319 RepID=A0AAV7RU68_PLEWA|nr:hypothetical protein NDU88_008243 [Pleurodeles waltl]
MQIKERKHVFTNRSPPKIRKSGNKVSKPLTLKRSVNKVTKKFKEIDGKNPVGTNSLAASPSTRSKGIPYQKAGEQQKRLTRRKISRIVSTGSRVWLVIRPCPRPNIATTKGPE